MSIRPVRHQSTAVPHLEGAGVNLQRAFGFDDPSMTDPFLLFDDFRNDRPENYLKPGSPGIRTAASRPSPMCWPARSSMATASATWHARRRRRAVDDRRLRHHAPGNAQGRL
jgi:hypothetical protein